MLCKFLMSTAISLCFLSSPLFSMEDPRETEVGSLLTAPASVPQENDEFNFLSNTFPLLVPEAEKSFAHCHEETWHYTELRELMEQTRESAEVVLIKGVKEALGRKTLHWFGSDHEQFVLDQLQPMIVRLRENHPTHGYFKTFFARALENHTLLENIVLTAEYMFQMVQDEGGGTVVFLGRSPCLFQVAYEEVLSLEKDKTQTLVHLNFSGHSDALTKRKSDFFKSKINIVRDIVTPPKRSHYFDYLDTKGMQQAKKLFIADILTSGGSLNSFLRIMSAYYLSRGLSVPSLCFLHLTQDASWSLRSPFYTFESGGGVSNRGILSLPEDKEKNMRSFQLPAYGIPVFDKVLTAVVDQDMFQEFLVHGIQYPAQKWTPEFDAQREQGGAYHRSFYEYLRSRFSCVIEVHKKQMQSTE